MRTIRYTLVADGSSDSVLRTIIEWVIRTHRPELGILGEFATALGGVGLSLDARIPRALALFPCDILMVHRDAEGETLASRVAEIERAVDGVFTPWVPIVPVRMTEAWLFSDEAAIRSAAENKTGRVELSLPKKARWEQLQDPKALLFATLELASEKSPRALRKFNPARQRALVVQRTSDFSALRGLPAFDLFEAKLIDTLKDF